MEKSVWQKIELFAFGNAMVCAYWGWLIIIVRLIEGELG